MRHRGDREIHALDALEPADDQHVVAVRPHAQPIGQRRRMIQALGGDAVERLEPSRGVVRVGEHATAFAEHLRVELEQLLAEADVGLAVLEVAVGRAAQLVRGAMLVDHPRDLARVPGEIRRESGWRSADRWAGRCWTRDRAGAMPPLARAVLPSAASGKAGRRASTSWPRCLSTSTRDRTCSSAPPSRTARARRRRMRDCGCRLQTGS